MIRFKQLRWSMAMAMVWCAHRALSAQTGPLTILDRVTVDARKPIDFHAAAFPETLYVGQQTTYQVAVLLNADARARLRRNPEFLPPELRGLLAYELGRPTRVPPRSMNGGVYEAHVFQRALFPVATGPLAVPAPQLSYGLPQSSSYFSREEHYVVRAESAHLVVRALPAEGRPDTFTGAVGVLRASTHFNATSARVGEPIVLTLRVQGIGNVKLLPRPNIEIEWASAVAGSERVQVDSSGPLVRGAKEFDWILTPTHDGSVALPILHYDYFDPYLRKYAIADTPIIPLEVAAGVLVANDETDVVALLPLRERNATIQSIRGLTLDSPSSRILVLVLCMFAPLPALLLALRRRTRTSKRVVRPSAVQLLQTLAPSPLDGNSNVEDAGALARRTRRVFHLALADRLGVAMHQLVSRRQIERVLRRRGVSRASTLRVLLFLDELDIRGFAISVGGATTTTTTDYARAASDLFTLVDSEAMHGAGIMPYTMHAAGLGGALVCLLVAATRIATAQTDSSNVMTRIVRAATVSDTGVSSNTAAFKRAVDAYQTRRFTEAVQRFADLARTHPLDVDAAANWGTSAWAAGDTVHAVIGWQRAARRDPLAADLQQRLALLPAGARGGLAEVAMVPVPALQGVAVAAWVIGWAFIAYGQTRRSRVNPRRWDGVVKSAGLTLCMVAVSAAGIAVWGRRALDATGLGVVVRPETMHVAPGADADALGGVSTGDVVRVLEKRDGWDRVRHADGRLGWLPSLRIVAVLDNATAR